MVLGPTWQPFDFKLGHKCIQIELIRSSRSDRNLHEASKNRLKQASIHSILFCIAWAQFYYLKAILVVQNLQY